MITALMVATSIVLAAQAREGASLILYTADSGIFPERWTKPPFNVTAAPVDPNEKERAQRLVARALAKYPPPLLARTLHGVYILGQLRFFGTQMYSGTASARAVYLVVRSEREGYTDRFIESRFHAEFSTLLLNRYLRHFDQSSWNAVNPEGFQYLGSNSWDRRQGKDGGNVAIDQRKASLAQTSRAENLEHGFLTEYSRSSIENDLNEYAAALFLNEPGFRELVTKHRGVARKRDLAIRFYQAVDPTLAPSWFDQLGGAR